MMVRLGSRRQFWRSFWRSGLGLGMLVVGLLLAGVAVAQPVQVTDGRGRVLRLPAPPQRIVSLLPSLSESVCALGACARLVGVDRYSNWPQELTRLPQVGGGLDPNIETIVALRPDVVLASVSSRANERLEALGLTVVALEPKTHAQVRQVLGVLGDLLGVPPVRVRGAGARRHLPLQAVPRRRHQEPARSAQARLRAGPPCEAARKPRGFGGDLCGGDRVSGREGELGAFLASAPLSFLSPSRLREGERAG